jgi:hypothetical protein
MEKNLKELQLKDLCGRLPYGVKVKVTEVPTQFSKDEVLTYNRMYSLSEPEEYITVKSYLRPLSSMTEKEKDELLDLCDMYDPYHDTDPYDDWGIQMFTQHVHSDTAKYIAKNLGAVMDWLNAHHFDYNGLISIGLALEAKEGMYNFK